MVMGKERTGLVALKGMSRDGCIEERRKNGPATQGVVVKSVLAPANDTFMFECRRLNVQRAQSSVLIHASKA